MVRWEQTVAIAIIVALIASLAMVKPPSVRATTPRTIIVPDEFPSIQEAIYNASAGDIVYVRAGNYTVANPPLLINQSISLVGEDWHDTIITTKVTYLRVYALGYEVVLAANNVTVSGFTINGVKNAVYVGSGGCLTNNIINLPLTEDTAAVTVESGIVSSNIINGERAVMDSKNFLTFGNMGVTTESAESVIISNNLISGFGTGVWVYGRNLSIINNTLANNNVGVGIDEATDSMLWGNNIVNSTAFGLYTMANVNAAYNWWGTTDAQNISNLITVGKHTDISVTFSPFLTAPNPQAMPIQGDILSPTSIPPVPELSLLIILPLLLSVLSVALVLRHRKQVKKV